MDKIVYLDNCATTELCPAARKVIIDNLDEYYNVNSSYEPAHKLKVKVEDSREKIAELIGAMSADEIYFTSGGSEANSWALNDRIILTSTIEHSSILQKNICKVQENGIIDPINFANVMKDILMKAYWIDHIKTVSVQFVNNELGTIQPIKDITKIAQNNRVYMHVDAVQALPHMRIDVNDLNINMLSASSHKFNGPKGVGFLYKTDNCDIHPLIYGGSQERGIRGGTTNTVGVMAMAAALEDTVVNLDETNERIAYLSAILEENLLNVSGVHDNVLAPKERRIPGVLNLRVENCRGSDIVTMASEYGICISAGSACHEGNADPSHVLKVIGLSDEEALSSIRISIGRYNTEEDIRYACNMLPKIITQLRRFW